MDASNAELKQHLLECLGGPFPEPGPLRTEVAQTTAHDGYRLESLSYEAEPDDRVPAYLLIPDGVDADHPAPAVVVWHQHNGQWDLGKSEPAGLAGDPAHHTGVALAKAGFVVLCPDALCFEGRASDVLPGRRFEEFTHLGYLTQGKSLAWKNIVDARRAVDLLESRPEVDAGRMGAYGHSMGSTIAWLSAPWEPRLACVVANCCLPTYQAIREHHLTHCFTNFVPGWERHGDTPDIAALIAPTPLLMNFGELDADSPLSGVLPGIDVIARAYAAQGALEAFDAGVEPGAGHELTDVMWARALGWFRTHLGD